MTQRLRRRPAFRVGSMCKDPQCIVTFLIPGKRMSSGTNRSLCSQTRGALSSENWLCRRKGWMGWMWAGTLSPTFPRKKPRTRGGSAICLLGSTRNKPPLDHSIVWGSGGWSAPHGRGVDISTLESHFQQHRIWKNQPLLLISVISTTPTVCIPWTGWCFWEVWMLPWLSPSESLLK